MSRMRWVVRHGGKEAVDVDGAKQEREGKMLLRRQQQYEQLPDTGTVIGALRQLRIPFDSPMLSPDKPVGAQHRARPAGQSLVGSGLDRRA